MSAPPSDVRRLLSRYGAPSMPYHEFAKPQDGARTLPLAQVFAILERGPPKT